MVAWETISRPKYVDGWGTMDSCVFGVSLLLKSLWQALFGGGIWGQIIAAKYLRDHHISHCLVKQEIGNKQGSYIWSNFQKIKSWFFQRVNWMFNRGNLMLIGQDMIAGVNETNILSVYTINLVHRKGIFYLEQVIIGWDHCIPIWMQATHICPLCVFDRESVEHLLFTCIFAMQVWSYTLSSLGIAGTHFTSTELCLKWGLEHGGYMVFVPPFVLWEIWKTWNHAIFWDRTHNVYSTVIKILGWLKYMKLRPST